MYTDRILRRTSFILCVLMAVLISGCDSGRTLLGADSTAPTLDSGMVGMERGGTGQDDESVVQSEGAAGDSVGLDVRLR